MVILHNISMILYVQPENGIRVKIWFVHSKPRMTYSLQPSHSHERSKISISGCIRTKYGNFPQNIHIVHVSTAREYNPTLDHKLENNQQVKSYRHTPMNAHILLKIILFR